MVVTSVGGREVLPIAARSIRKTAANRYSGRKSKLCGNAHVAT
jgi:hypothetical protein